MTPARADPIRGCLFFLGVLAGMATLLSGCRPAEVGNAMERREFAMKKLGEVIQQRMPGAPVLVIGNPFVESRNSTARATEKALIRGLNEGLGKDRQPAIRVAHPELKPGALENPQSFEIPPGTTTPVTFLTTPGAWDQLREKFPEPVVWVSLIGVPVDGVALLESSDARTPKWVFFLPDLRMLGPVAKVSELLEQGRVLGVVLNRPGAPHERETSASDEEEFARRYVLITQENAAEVPKLWPLLYPTGESSR